MSQNRTDLQVEILPATEVAPADVVQWDALRQREKAYRNPLFSAAFAREVGRWRDDAQVAIFRRDGKALGFLAHHRRPGGLGRPIGAPFADYHAFVASPDLDGREALEGAGLKAFRHNGLIDPHAAFPEIGDEDVGYAIELTGSPDAYVEALRAASPKRFKNWRRLRHRLEEMGPLEVRASTSQAHYDTLMSWKRAQFVRTGVVDVLRPAWSRGLMQSLFETRGPGVAGLMVTFHAGDRLIGGHFGVREGGVYHPWIASTDPDLAYTSPGQAFLHHAILAMPLLGLDVYDLGVGTDHYKQPFCNVTRPIGAGLSQINGLGPTSDLRTPITKIRRRLDHIAATDPTLGGRVHGVFQAAMALRKRSLLTETPVRD